VCNYFRVGLFRWFGRVGFYDFKFFLVVLVEPRFVGIGVVFLYIPTCA